ncbi:hypothetical protein OESDEN_25015 [Oesophagostomum dentatum]|uniref:Uncharacterized protein n=1 Tax=Oesophagostomum dentatum TaxID=61180 RepID=A0A0B1RRV2_OESDE|nr:hypothetical protein OESDEN_25015 [Oesophagostomum dentatum]
MLSCVASAQSRSPPKLRQKSIRSSIIEVTTIAKVVEINVFPSEISRKFREVSGQLASHGSAYGHCLSKIKYSESVKCWRCTGLSPSGIEYWSNLNLKKNFRTKAVF